MIERFKQLEALKLTAKRLNVKQVKNGDIIFFNPMQINDENRWHVAIVYDVNNNYICYMDVNGKLGTMGFNYEEFGSRKIHSIYDVSFAFWIGDLLINEQLQNNKL